ncbi:hypothetical protein Daus18300_003352 [Diaporthe australafricana]|uniref:Uncharacterized protein n=1 Tax=Diaporthe australafricana TaxID=127596 RepID=A0ABR3XGF4_9PEZI
MAVCQISANSGSYGVGTRIAFYLQWFGMIITSWVLESDALNLKFINALTTAATSVGLVLNLGKLQSHFQTICDLIVAAIITVAIELVIFWNKIKGANDLDSAAQLMPPVITGAYLRLQRQEKRSSLKKEEYTQEAEALFVPSPSLAEGLTSISRFPG